MTSTLVTVALAHASTCAPAAYVEIPVDGTWITADGLVAEARTRLACHFGESALEYASVSSRLDLHRVAGWCRCGSGDPDAQAFYLRDSGSHGWLCGACKGITQTG